ncbi:HAD-IA family hydrolase [Desulforhopalus sp. IMCC35007]|uniref:HAD-IA family hydrolase n=1 Tax=Desulforhopalus sp. IMCC35007 TaxID=2569543 RepID=UPI0010AE0A4A|nr:HAD-IA family hydrolase [Desulforhopalus sp. IMCC35007]TKB06922.1 HAD family hydrolase [Desulforhopalus sp. IMCC35007]
MNRPVLLFDLDGTISDPLVGIWRCINYGLTSLGYKELEKQAVGRYIGPPLDETFRAVTGCEDKGEATAFVVKFRERFAEVGFSENTLYPGIPEAISALKDKGYNLGICTSKREDFARTILQMFGLYGQFQFISGGDIGIHKYQQIETLMANKTIDAHAIMIGDRATDIIAGHRNGLETAAVLWGYGTRTELEAETPRYYFEKVSDLPEILH